MGLYRPNYWNNYPEPFYPGWQNEPIPGWGVRPVMAGPARVGVGATPSVKPTLLAGRVRLLKKGKTDEVDEGAPGLEAGPRVPGYVYVMSGLFVLGGLVALGRNLGWGAKMKRRIK